MLQATQNSMQAINPHDGKVFAIWREPFKLGTPVVETWEYGQTVAEIVARMPCLPDDFAQRGMVRVNDVEVPRALWDVVRPKATSAEKPVSVTMHVAVQGGGGGGGKKIFSLIAVLALTILTVGIAQLGIPALGAAFAAGTTGAKLLAAGVGIVGSLVIGALSSTPARAEDQANTNADGGSTLDPAAISGNVLEPNVSIPRVIGRRRVFPPFLFEPIVEIIGQDEIVDAVYGLSGPHEITDIRLSGSTVSPEEVDADVIIKYTSGLPDEPGIKIPARYGRTFTLNAEMSVHGTDPDNLAVFANPLPVYHAMSTADDPDESWIHLLSYGLTQQDNFNDALRIPFRIRMRLRGEEDWRYLPEVHYMDATQSQRRMQFKFRFHETYVGVLPNPPQNRGFVEARKRVPGQNVTPLQPDFNCDPYFSKGGGNDIYRYATNETTNVINMSLEAETVTFYLSSESWPRGIYDIEIKRGSAFYNKDFTSDTYVYSGQVIDFYGEKSGGFLPMSRQGLLDKINLSRIVNIKRQPPIAMRNIAMIYLQVRNRSVSDLSIEAGGYVRDWNGTAWANMIVTDNPAPHFVDILCGPLNLDPLPDEMRDDESLVEWRQACIDNGYTCNLVTEGAAIAELQRIVASCGYARPYQSEIWGVIRDYDRSDESPVQIFSPRNINDFKWKKAFPRLPAGFRVNFKDEDYDYSGKQILVFRAGADETDARTEQISYVGLVNRDDCIARAGFDLRNAQYRSALYTFNAPAESIVCRRGSLVGLNHDLLQRHYGSVRIDTVQIDDDGKVVGLILDSEVDVKNSVDMLALPDILAVDDMLEVGLQTAIGIRQTNAKTSVYRVTNAAGKTKTLTFDPFENPDGEASIYDKGPVKQVETGCLVVIGTLGTEYKRFIVSDIAAGKDLMSTLTLVDEAPEIWETA